MSEELEFYHEDDVKVKISLMEAEDGSKAVGLEIGDEDRVVILEEGMIADFLKSLIRTGIEAWGEGWLQGFMIPVDFSKMKVTVGSPGGSTVQ